MAMHSCSVHSCTNPASKHSVNCLKAGLVSETPSLAQDHFSHSKSTGHNVSAIKRWMECVLLPIRIIFHQLLSFILSSRNSWWWAIDIACANGATSSSPDHKVSRISPSTWATPSTKLSVNFGKHSGMCAARCHFPTAPIISKELKSSKNSDSDTHCRKWILHWQQIL